MQPEFSAALLAECRKQGIHTALDTSGYAEPEIIDMVLPHTDLFLYDLKLADDAQHQTLHRSQQSAGFEKSEENQPGR
jgi:pyruvate-formate lyase-activating enzyme